MSTNIEGKVVVITGASSGLGESTARHLAELGATVVLGSEGLRMETRKDNIRVTILSPGAVDSELKEGSSDAAASQNVKEFYKIAIPADSIARAIAYAIEQPSNVEIDEIVVRPTVQEF